MRISSNTCITNGGADMPPANHFGVDPFVQGTVVQGSFCPRDISPRRLLSKDTLVQGDFCPMYKLEILIVVNIIFLFNKLTRLSCFNVKTNCFILRWNLF